MLPTGLMVLGMFLLHVNVACSGVVSDANVPVDCNATTDCNVAPLRPPHDAEPNSLLSLEAILAHTQKAADSLTSLQCHLVYENVSLPDSTTIRKGDIFYARQAASSDLRVRFDTKKVDETPEIRYREDMLFDGVWWTHVDYEGRSVQKRQLAPEDAPMDAMDLATQDLPIFGFSGVDQWREAYSIKRLADSQDQGSTVVCLRLSPHKPDDESNEYQSVEVWVDPNSWIPTQVEAENLNGEVFRLRFWDVSLNKKLPVDTFKLVLPDNFGKVEITPLK